MSSSPNPNPNSPPETLALESGKKQSRNIKKSSKKPKEIPSQKKLQAIEQKVQYLTKNLNPIPFKPLKTLDLTKHEKLLKNLGLWDFIHIEYDKKIRMDLITQLIVTYESKKRCGYVNGCRISLNRAALGNALKLSTKKKEKRKNSCEICDIMDVDIYDGEIISFMESLVMTYLVLCGDLPISVLSEIKSGHFERVDWCGLIWRSVEKEISQGVKLVDCWYGLHLQSLIWAQKKDVFVLEISVDSMLQEERGIQLEILDSPVENLTDEVESLPLLSTGFVDTSDEDTEKPCKSYWELEEEELFKQLNYCLEMDDSVSSDAVMVDFEENIPSRTVNDPASSCPDGGKHSLFLDEEIGLKCTKCFAIVEEIRNIFMPEFIGKKWMMKTQSSHGKL